MSWQTALVGLLYVLAIVGVALFGFQDAAGTAGPPLGFFVGILSAVSWALSTIVSPTWNLRLNLFAAMFAAYSLGLLAPAEKLCTGSPLSLLCR
jgi:drug/metabolite transporter (DMT)-like permease